MKRPSSHHVCIDLFAGCFISCRRYNHRFSKLPESFKRLLLYEIIKRMIADSTVSACMLVIKVGGIALMKRHVRKWLFIFVLFFPPLFFPPFS